MCLEWVIEGSQWLRFCGVFFFFFPPMGFDLVAEIHLLGFRQGRSATYLYKASHIRCIYHRHFDYTSWIVVTY